MKLSRGIAAVGAAVTCIGMVTACSDTGETLAPAAAEAAPDSPQVTDCDFQSDSDRTARRVQFPTEDVIIYTGVSAASPVRCIPGVGEYRLGPQNMLDIFGVTDPTHAILKAWQIAKDDDGWYGVALATVRTPSSGLTPGSDTMKIATIDLANSTAGKVVDVGPTVDTFAIGQDRVVVAIDVDEETPSVAAFDMTTGREAWRKDGARNANGSFLAGNSITLVSRVAERKTSYGANYGCMEVNNVDVATGAPRWSYNSLDPAYATPGARRECPRVDAALQTSSFTGVSVEQDPPVDSSTNKTVLTQFLRSNDSAGLVAAGIDASGAKQVPVEFRDPVSSLSVFDLVDRKRDSGVPMLVVDRERNEVVFELSAEQAGKLDATVRAIYDGKIYLENEDGTFIVDARTGVDASETWTNYPVGKINGHKVYRDGTVTK